MPYPARSAWIESLKRAVLRSASLTWRPVAFGLFTLVVCHTALAQVDVLSGYGFKLGYTRSALVTNFGRGATNYWIRGLDGVHMALFTEGLTRGALSVVTQIEYSRRGFEEMYLYGGVTEPGLGMSHATSNLDYLSVPVLFKLEDTRDRASAYALAGPQVDMLVHRSSGTLQTGEGPAASYLASALSRWGAGLRLGVGLEIRGMLPLPLRMEATYYLELTNGLSGENVQYEGEPIGGANRAFDFSVGFRL